MGEEENSSVFFFLTLHARSRELVDVFEKNEKKNKTTSVYRLPTQLHKSLQHHQGMARAHKLRPSRLRPPITCFETQP